MISEARLSNRIIFTAFQEEKKKSNKCSVISVGVFVLAIEEPCQLLSVISNEHWLQKTNSSYLMHLSREAMLIFFLQ